MVAVAVGSGLYLASLVAETKGGLASSAAVIGGGTAEVVLGAAVADSADVALGASASGARADDARGLGAGRAGGGRGGGGRGSGGQGHDGDVCGRAGATVPVRGRLAEALADRDSW